ncbi:MAG: phosphonoacetaldehyde hydrolase [Desulfococcaceae bacterium]
MESLFLYNRPYTGPAKAAVLDWAGTAVDYGCLGPVRVFVDVFAAEGVDVTEGEARQFMGLAKKDHIRAMCGLETVAERWRSAHDAAPDESDVDRMYQATEPLMVAAAARHADPIPGLLETVTALRERGIRIGTSTGYTAPMMDALVPVAEKNGYQPDAVFCASDVPAGRPFPWMCYRNAMALGVYPMAAMIKVGDTISDIQEGRNAGMWTVGVTRSGNELGLSEAEANALDPAELERRLSEIEGRFRENGAHFVIEGVWDLLPVVDAVEKRLALGETPLPAPDGLLRG